MLAFDTVEDVIRKNDFSSEISICEFGVYVGNSTYRIIDEFQKKNIKINHFFGFDSWKGLPAEKLGIKRSPDWAPGNFSAIEEFGVASTEEVIDIVQSKIKKIYPQGLEIVSGWFADTLHRETIRKHSIPQVDFVNLDTDLMISTEQVLNFLFENDLLKDGAIIRFDDYIASGLSFGTGGQSLAWLKAEQKYKICNIRISYNCYKIYKN